jgi:hypothetical protein
MHRLKVACIILWRQGSESQPFAANSFRVLMLIFHGELGLPTTKYPSFGQSVAAPAQAQVRNLEVHVVFTGLILCQFTTLELTCNFAC